MTPFEEELKRALARREPADGFVERVLAHVEERKAHGWWHWLRWTRVRVLAVVAALLFVLLGASIAYRQHERTVRGEAAKKKLLLALQIAGSKLHDAQQHVIEVETMEIEQ